MSGHRKKSTDRGALTFWRRKREGLVRTRKETNRPRRTHILETASGGTNQHTERIRPRGTHQLKMASGGTGQDTERIRPSEGHSLPEDGIGRDKSGHRKNPTERGALTNWRQHREGQVRTRKESDRARGTHELETALGGTSQNTERIRPSKGHSHPGDGIGGTSQDMERIRSSKGHSPTEDGIGKDKSGHGKTPTERGALTLWRRHREGQVRTQKESDRARGTHQLETASRGTSQHTKRIRPSKGHSPTGDDIGRDKSGHRKNPTKRGALTS